MIEIRFQAGTVEVHHLGADTNALPPSARWDPRAQCHRVPAVDYAEVVMGLRRASLDYDDQARQYTTLSTGALTRHEPRPYQSEAISAWKQNRGRGVVVLPTGAGKTHVAVLGIDAWRRSTLVVAPTLDLVRQWYDILRTAFRAPVGVIGGGEYEIQPLTVTTYDSAYIHMENLGARFGLIVFDECHHLPGSTYSLAAQLCLAPFRLGLTATPERADGRESALQQLIGPTVYRRDITDLSGDFLADYETSRVEVELSPEEREEYERERGIYRDFLRTSGIAMGAPDGWSQFIMRSSRDDAGRRAMRAYRRQRELAFCAPAKLEYVDYLLHLHRRDRSILFTQDNATCYRVSRQFLLPAITHQTRVKERSDILAGLADGRYGAVVTSKVLNEGVDVPDANVAIVMSGSGSVREHVQRLGRVLRKKGDKRALLYELVTSDTTETWTSQRRRDHSAYA